MPSYNPKAIEPRWQRFWLEQKTFRTPDSSDKPKFYALDMFPYPSGSGLHVGHPEGYTATDILCRYRRMRGDHVLHPMGWDAFGLPAEQYAIQTGTHPRETTQKNINTFRRQIQMLGFSYDWDREVDTTDPKYFRWTQWIFLQLFDTWYDAAMNKGRPIAELPIPADVKSQGESAIRRYQDQFRLAYQVEAPVNWCPALGTVLANEEVIDGKSERGSHPVVRMPLRQWMLRITSYAERLLDDLSAVDWPEPIKLMQRNWIGKSEGAEVDFTLAEASGGRQPPEAQSTIRVFTTRPDTLFGATYMVLAPEHPLVDVITVDKQRGPVKRYQEEAARKSDLERTELAKKKTGVFTGAFAINPVNGEKVPIWIADYVLISYGTGAIMAVPAHDERDFEFAKEFKLPIRVVVRPPLDWLKTTSVYRAMQHLEMESKGTATSEPDTLNRSAADLIVKASHFWRQYDRNADKVIEPFYLEHPNVFDEVFVDEGFAVHSAQFDNLTTAQFKQQITDWLKEKGKGSRKINYKLRDWLFSRQRYWGEPFPILHELDDQGQPTGVVIPLSAEELPLILPELEDYKPSGKPEPPLGKATDWVNVTKGGKKYRRETNTMPQWAGSCWYYLRYIDPKNDQAFVDPAKEKRFMPVDLYVGGAEHAVLHLLYSRFWHKVLYDRGHVSTVEPFRRLVNQGMILGEAQYHVAPPIYEAMKAMLTDKELVGVPVEHDGVPSFAIMNKPLGAAEKPFNLTEDQVEKRQGKLYLAGTEMEVTARADKMAKSRGNVINPDDVVNEYGADSLRLYEMFMGPLEATKPWSMRGVEGVYRFLGRVWRLIIDDRAEQMKLAEAVQSSEPERETLRLLHQTIQKVTEDLDGLRFNTAIAAMMEFTNQLTKLPARPKPVLETFVLLLSPFSPHLGEELWHALGHADTLAYEKWPTFDASLLRQDTVDIIVQVNGKVRHRLTVPAGCDETRTKEIVLADEKVKGLLEGKQIKKVIVVPGKLVNLVIG